MQGLNKQYPGGRHVLKDIHLNFLPGVKIAVIGVNGSGKSTLMRIMSGIDKDFTGEAWAAEGIRTGYLSQEPYLDPEKDVLGNVRDGVAAQQAILDRYNEILADYSDEVADEMARLQDEIDANNLWELDNQVDIAMDALRCPAGDADVTTLSGGERRRVALCRLLLEKPDLLMLDEPTNHLDAESVAWLERFLQEYKGTVVLVTHDRYFLDNVVGWVLELDRGHGIPFEGNYSQWLEAKQKRLSQEERKEEAKEKALARELEWIRSSPKARQAKSKARIRAYDEMLQEQQEKLSGTAQIKMQPPGRLGGKVIEFEGVSKAFGDRLLYENLTFSLPPGGIVGVIGPNGAGKTTLFKLITGEETPDAGGITIGETVKLGYVDQSRDALDDNKTVWEEVSGGDDVFYFGKTEIATRSYVGAFNFKGSDQQKKVGLLSGGERNRVHLAKMLRKGGNVLLLDEPTNDLDVETLRALEEALENFAGCAVVISHDRFFLDRLATHILAFEGDSHVEWFEGNFQAYEADRKRRLGDDANTPHRLKFKKFDRS
ncbi:energy-dependent translational throttle protein EttA [Iodidimonas muriae]|uniref:Energy-dependent translational throttle protein EttA n=2 Tax=Iodidimonas muriae TaxID=261467 RepID=A0ABQ2L8P1_9PROT|nr:energy-dependent translational throttle protein EttA [Kordiimonadales bacterium JCM 17843]GGO06892.1 energy-dependent translational throttle protein EttA [Iodidimonas muriae]